MSVKYDLYQTPVPNDRKEKNRFHARVVTQETVGSEKLAKLIHSQSSLTVGDIQSVIISLKEAIISKLKEGKRIHIEGIGYFQMTVSCPPIHSAKDIRAESILFKSVAFRPEKSLKQELATTQFTRAPYKKHSTGHSVPEADTILADYFADHTYITCTDFERICNFTRTTANRRIRKLVEEGKLIREGVYRSPIYTPAPGFYGQPTLTTHPLPPVIAD